jgi:hypothetical protein
MDYSYILIFLFLLILFLLNYDTFVDLPKGYDLNCAGLAAGPDMTCGNQKQGRLSCKPDANDCFLENNIKKCYCKMQE